VSRLSEIPIVVAAAAAQASSDVGAGGLGRGGLAILVELATLLERLADADLEGAIDLHSMPMSDLDRTRLQSYLGRGEVRAFLDAEGISEIQETAIAGIWWIQHRDKQGDLVAEVLEVTAVPKILARARDEIASAVLLLRERIDASPPNRVIAPQYGR
jgi:hydrogenase-1 operon protein HyaF